MHRRCPQHRLQHRYPGVLLRQPTATRHEQTSLVLGTALTGEKYPLSMRAAELDSRWRVVYTDLSVDDNNQTLRRLYRVDRLPRFKYFTRGETIAVASETYLVAYRAEPSVAEMQRLRVRREATQPQDAKLSAQTELRLCLLNILSVGRELDARAFNPKVDVESAQETASANRLQSINNLRIIGMALVQYAQEYDEVLPPMRGATSQDQLTSALLNTPGRESVQYLIRNFIPSPQVFRQPGTNTLYQPNFALSGRNLDNIRNTSRIVAFYERTATQGFRALLFLDGHVKVIRESEWPRIKRESFIAR
jgi:hypothetical protein